MRVAVAFALLMLLSTAQASVHGPLMVGYTGFYLLPFLDGGSLGFQVGEELWAMAPSAPTELKLASPDGRLISYSLEPGRPVLLYRFSADDPAGRWVLESPWGSMSLRLTNPWGAGANLTYGVSAGALVVRVEGSERVVFLSDEGGGLLLVAGEEQRLPLTLDAPEGSEVIADLLYPRSLHYRGVAGESNYTLYARPLAGRIVGRLEEDGLRLRVPGLGKVGAGGVMPFRFGEAVLRLSYEGDGAALRDEHAVYVLDKAFAEFSGARVSRELKIPLELALNTTITLLTPDPAAPNSSARALELKPPVGAARFYDPRHGLYAGNLSVVSETLPGGVLNGTAYFALLKEEAVYPEAAARPGVAGAEVTVYVNGFRAGSMRLGLRLGEVVEEELGLMMLEVTVLGPEGGPADDAELRVNGRTLPLEGGRARYLLPPGRYVVEAVAGGLRDSVELELEGDVKVVLRLGKPLGLIDLLKGSAAAEAVGLAVLAALNLRAGRVFRAWRARAGEKVLWRRSSRTRAY